MTRIQFSTDGGITGFLQECYSFSILKGREHNNTLLCLFNAGAFGYGGVTGKVPSNEDKDAFAIIYFLLQTLVDNGVLQPPRQGDDPHTLDDFFWETTGAVPATELLEILRKWNIRED